jgi:hypothetical protein
VELQQAAIVGIVGLLITLAIQLASVTFKSGRNEARIDELERWRSDMRRDMHEISEQLQRISRQVSGVETLIDERTERRTLKRVGDQG